MISIKRIVSFLLIVLLYTSLHADPVRIACVGNSITYGAGISDRDQDNYAGQLQKLLGDDYDVRAFGVSGRKLMHNCDPAIWDEPEFPASLDFNPDIVIILLGTNDVKLDCWDLHKEEFIPEFSAMIDTFRALPAEPVVYCCYPPPVFGTYWGPRDSVITTELLAIMDTIAVQKNIDLIDFNTPFRGMNELFPDDIHPSAHGSWLMAKIIYEKLTDKSIEVLQDVNVVRGAAITVDTGTETAPNLIDGNQYTCWTCSAETNTAVIILSEIQSVDMFQIFFNNNIASLPRVTVEVSSDSASWTSVLDQAAQDSATSNIIIAGLDSVETKYIKLILSEVTSDISVSEFRALATAPIHAPVMKYDFVKKTTAYVRVNLITMTTHSGNYIRNMFRRDPEDIFDHSKHFRKSDGDTTLYLIGASSSYEFISSAYADNYEVFSADTFILDMQWTDVQAEPTSNVLAFDLFQNHPNPFNPETKIKYSTKESGRISVQIFNVNGQLVRTLTDSCQAPGTYEIIWNGKDDRGIKVVSGAYFVAVTMDSHSLVKKMMLVR